MMESTEGPDMSTEVAQTTEAGEGTDGDAGGLHGLESFLVPALFSVITAAGILGNILVILVNLRNRDYFCQTANQFILNLSIADLLFLVFCAPFHAVVYILPSWPFGEFLCKFVHLVQYTSMLAGVLLLTAMAVDRYTVIAFPLKLKPLRTPRIAVVTSLVIWGVSLAVASPMGVVYTVISYGDDVTSGGICADNWDGSLDSRATYFLLLAILGFAVPLVTIITFSVVSVNKLSTAGILNDVSRSHVLLAKRKVTRMMLVLVTLFAVCWLPTHTLNVWINYFPHTVSFTYGLYYAKIGAHTLSYLNSALNPYIYIRMSANFRSGLARACRCCPDVCGASGRRVPRRTTSSRRSGKEQVQRLRLGVVYGLVDGEGNTQLVRYVRTDRLTSPKDHEHVTPTSV